MKYCDACHSAYPDDYAVCPRDQGPLRVASELLPGMVLRGKYEILEKVGSGGMASVYRARHLAFAEVCAIKVVAGKLSHDETFLRRFRNEAVVTRRLQHAHAVRVDDLDTTEDGRPFIVMEFVEGRNLRDVIRQEAPLPPRRAVAITRQVASALSAAHALGIVHRDIKPDNILLTRDGAGHDHAKVLDFGIAKVKETVLGEDAYTPTRTGMVVGTPQYVSPEQAMGKRGEEIDGRSDVYSLGVVLYEMVTGRLP
ncbi:MAG TPA: serine/threonine-protein kinase, partial [Vicinamibacteria bacterium]|nr:serine/threonine-protein kinase [Vicinamibacteria bacterium]